MNPKNKTIKIVKVRKQVRKMYIQKATLCKKSTKQTKNYKEKKETKKKKKQGRKLITNEERTKERRERITRCESPRSRPVEIN